MRYVNLFLALTVILCYGFGGSVNRPCTFTETTNSYTDRQDEASGADILAKSYMSIKLADQEMPMCHQALLNAHDSYDFSPFLSLITVSIPNLEAGKISSFPLSTVTRKEYRPPDLFLINSSLLL
jgi:hypothetical protein